MRNTTTETMFDHHYNSKPSCLDAAYERTAISTGLMSINDATFPENKLWVSVPDPRQQVANIGVHLHKDDPVNRPSHYTYGSIEAITVIEDWKLNFNRGNALKYIARAGHKENAKQDIEKAIWYLTRELNALK